MFPLHWATSDRNHPSICLRYVPKKWLCRVPGLERCLTHADWFNEQTSQNAAFVKLGIKAEAVYNSKQKLRNHLVHFYVDLLLFSAAMSAFNL